MQAAYFRYAQLAQLPQACLDQGQAERCCVTMIRTLQSNEYFSMPKSRQVLNVTKVTCGLEVKGVLSHQWKPSLISDVSMLAKLTFHYLVGQRLAIFLIVFACIAKRKKRNYMVSGRNVPIDLTTIGGLTLPTINRTSVWNICEFHR